MKCSNCEQGTAGLEGLTVSNGEDELLVAYLCTSCTKDVLMLKIVLTRKAPTDAFAFEGYLPVAVVK